MSNSRSFESFEDFEEGVKELYHAFPDTTRLVIKYKRPDGVMIRATNDAVCLKFTAKFSDDVRKADRLNGWLLSEMCGVEE